MNISFHNDKNVIDKISHINIKNKTIFLKLRFNSNNSSIESISVQSEENSSKNSENNFEKSPPKEYSTINIQKNIKNDILSTVRNEYYFCTKENVSIHQYNLKNNEFPINITSEYNKETNKIFTKIQVFKNSLKNSQSSITKIHLDRKKVSSSDNSRTKNLKKLNIKKIMNITAIKNPFIKKKDLNIRGLSSNKKFHKKIPLLSINNNNRDLVKINIDNNTKNENENEDEIINHIPKYPKHRGMSEKCPLCIKMAKIVKYNENQIFGYYSKLNITKRFRINHFKNKKYIFNKNIIDSLKKQEINKLKIINNNNKNNNNINILKDNPFVNNLKNKTYLKKSLSNLIKKKYNTKRTRNTLDNFDLKDKETLNSYTHLINIEFPIINSYFYEKVIK